jgi:hypothetical protein
MTPDNGSAGNEANAAGLTSEDSAASRDVAISGGLMTWAAAVSGPLAGCTCLWQDLDGLHVEPPPTEAPPTSILWGWRGDSYLVRARLDGDDAYVAIHQAPAGSAAATAGAALERTVPWALDDGRVAASAGRSPGPDAGGVGARYEQVIVRGIETSPITFVCPVRDA